MFGDYVMDDRLMGKSLRPEEEAVGLRKLVAAPSFMESLSSSGTVIATVRVSQPHYVPEALILRTRLSPTLFTASMSKKGLMATLGDAAVESIQPSQVISTDVKL
jgi:hypothetical protein